MCSSVIINGVGTSIITPHMGVLIQIKIVMGFNELSRGGLLISVKFDLRMVALFLLKYNKSFEARLNYDGSKLRVGLCGRGQQMKESQDCSTCSH